MLNAFWLRQFTDASPGARERLLTCPPATTGRYADPVHPCRTNSLSRNVMSSRSSLHRRRIICANDLPDALPIRRISAISASLLYARNGYTRSDKGLTWRALSRSTMASGLLPEEEGDVENKRDRRELGEDADELDLRGRSA